MSEQDNDEELDSQNQSTEQVVENAEESVEETTEEKPEFTEAEKAMYQRAKKAEAAAKLAKQEKAELEKRLKQTNSPPSTDADELRLIARGLSDEEIDQAKVIAKGTDKSLSEAIKSPLFVAFQKDLKDQQRKEKAKLNASKGSSQESDKSTSDMSRDEHQKLAMEMAKNIQ